MRVSVRRIAMLALGIIAMLPLLLLVHAGIWQWRVHERDDAVKKRLVLSSFAGQLLAYAEDAAYRYAQLDEPSFDAPCGAGLPTRLRTIQYRAFDGPMVTRVEGDRLTRSDFAMDVDANGRFLRYRLRQRLSAPMPAAVVGNLVVMAARIDRDDPEWLVQNRASQAVDGDSATLEVCDERGHFFAFRSVPNAHHRIDGLDDLIERMLRWRPE